MNYTRMIYVIRGHAARTRVRYTMASAMREYGRLLRLGHAPRIEIREVAAAHGHMYGAFKMHYYAR